MTVSTTQQVADAEELHRFMALAKRRRAIRSFLPDPVPEETMRELLEAARWAPSGYNLQPIHFVVVTEQATREALCDACLGQRQVREAGATVVFLGDREVAANHLDAVIESERAASGLNERYEAFLRKYVRLGFATGPIGLGWLWKFLAQTLGGQFRPVPSFPAVERRYWLAKQGSLSAMNFMLAAEAAGLGTCPMEGFGERAVRRVLGIPASQAVLLVCPVGKPAPHSLTKTRLPLDSLVHHERW